MHAFDGQTDGQTDRQTDGFAIAIPRSYCTAVKTDLGSLKI